MRNGVISLMFFSALVLSAQASYAAMGGKDSHGDLVCASNLPCPVETQDVKAIFPIATSCVSRYFGFKTDSELFDTSRGLGVDMCLSSMGSQKFGSSSTPLAPHCCLVKDEETDSCKLLCGVVVSK